MKSMNDLRTIMIIEDHEGYIDLLKEICRDALSPLEISDIQDAEGADVYLVVAKTPEEARHALKERDVYLSTVDINLSGELFRSKAAEGMEILEEIKAAYPLVCPVVVSSEDTDLHQKKALRKFDAIDYIQKKHLDEKRSEIKNLLRTTFVYAEALRLFDDGEWSQADLIWQTIVNENSDFVEIDGDTKNLGERLIKRRSSLTGLPGREWVWQELDRLRKDVTKTDWAIVLISIEGFKSFQDLRKLKGAEDVLVYVAQELKETIQDINEDKQLTIADLLTRFQSSDNVEAVDRVFLGETDNTGLFVLVTSSFQIAEKLKQSIDEGLVNGVLKSFHSHKEKESDNVDLMSISTKVKTFNDIMTADGTDYIARDRFEELLFEDFGQEPRLNDQRVTNEENSQTFGEQDASKKKTGGWFRFFRSG